MTDPDRTKNEADFRTFLVLFVLMALAALFVFMTAIVLPQALGIVLVAGGRTLSPLGMVVAADSESRC